MKYCPISTTCINPASIQNLLTLFSCESNSIRSSYRCNRRFWCDGMSFSKRTGSWWRHEQVSIAAGVVRRPTRTGDSGNKEGRGVREARSPTGTEHSTSGAHRSDRSRRHSSGDTHPTFGLPSALCARGEGVQGVLTLFCSGAAQVCHDDRVVELKEQLEVEEEGGYRQEEEVEERGEVE